MKTKFPIQHIFTLQPNSKESSFWALGALPVLVVFFCFFSGICSLNWFSRPGESMYASSKGSGTNIPLPSLTVSEAMVAACIWGHTEMGALEESNYTESIPCRCLQSDCPHPEEVSCF